MNEKALIKEIEKDKEEILKEKLIQNKESFKKESCSSIKDKQSLNFNNSFSQGQTSTETKINKTQNDKKYINVNPFSSSAFKTNEDIIKKAEEKLKRKNDNDKLNKEDDINDLENNAHDIELSSDKEIVNEKRLIGSSQIIDKPNYDFIETLTSEEKEKIFVFQDEKQQDQPKPKKNKFKLIIVSILFAIFGIWGIVNIAQLDSVTTQYSINLASYLNNLHNLDATNAENMENLFPTIPDEELSPNEIDKKSNWFDKFCNFLAGLFGG